MAESVAWRMWQDASRTVVAPPARAITLDDAAKRFLEHCETYYRRADGTQTREAVNCELALRSIRARCGRKDVDEMGYQDLLDARSDLIGSGLNRETVNQRVGIWRRFAAWALDNRLCSAQTKAEFWAVGALKRGRTQAPEGDPVLPVSHRIVKLTIAEMPPNLAAMVRVHELCGARPGEICDMRPCDIERRRGCWVYRPATHKTAHKGGIRVIALGPMAQRILEPWMSGPAEARVFRPSLGDRGGGDSWNPTSYGRAINYARRAAKKKGIEMPLWAPNQLRHAAGTRVRRKFGPESAAIVLGHSSGGRWGSVTDRYTLAARENELLLAASRVMIRIG
jgi:integrase